MNSLVIYFPRVEYVLKDRIVNKGYDLLELIYLGNVMEDRLDIQKKILVDLSMLDTYLEFSYKRKCISLKKMQRGARYLTIIRKMVYGWIKSASKV